MSTGIDWSQGPTFGVEDDGYTESDAMESAVRELRTKIDPEPDAQTPDPTSDTVREGGPIRRANEFMSTLGPAALEQIGLHGDEIAEAISTRQSELFRNEFPRLEPAFVVKCTECATEYTDERDECDECGSADLRRPSQKERQRAEQFFDHVNKEGQSLRQLYKYCEGDHSRLGTGLHIIKKQYTVAGDTLHVRGSAVVQEGQIINEEPRELVRGDPKYIKPVVDENGRIGNYWWTCPIHRHDGLDNKDGHCRECGCPLREVHYAEVKQRDAVEKYYFEDEVVSWSLFHTRLNGLDGLSPVSHHWLEQAILHWMDVYAAGFYDDDNKKYPGKMLIVHTTNKDAFEKTLDEAKTDAEDSAYAQGIIYNEYGLESNSAPEAQVVDMMSDEILGQSDEIKKDYTNNIRTAYGIADVFDSELEDAGGLNNEGLQLEVTDREMASAHQDLQDGPLQKLMRVLGFDDWRLAFVPPEREETELTVKEKAQTIRILKDAGAEFEVTDDGGVEVLGAGDEPPESRPGATQPVLEEGGGPPNGGEAGNASADDGGSAEALRQMEAGFKHIVWGPQTPRVGQKAAAPYWSADEDVPEFVRGSVEEAVTVATSPSFDKIDDADAVGEFFADRLTQPQGWSQASLRDGLADRFDVSEGYAEAVVQDQVTAILNKAREIGYEQAGADPGAADFHWVGPDDADTTDACQWIKEQSAGGVPLDELKSLVAEANSQFFPDHPAREWQPHFSCRHTYTQQSDG